MAANNLKVAYFSMEMALDEAMPTYAGGLGVLAGDTLRSAADLGVPMVGVTLLHRKGYFRQRLDAEGNQREEPEAWNPGDKLELMKPTVTVTIEGRTVHVRAWRFLLKGVSEDFVPVYLLDTAFEPNSEWDRTLTDQLYLGDDRYRLCQEVVLGMGGIEILPKLGHAHLGTFHMNEGHSALLGLALLERRLEGRGHDTVNQEDVDSVRHRCVFTTHTPVPAGHDKFPQELERKVLGEERVNLLERTGCHHDGTLNMTYLALRFSHYINGVGMHHGEVSKGMFPRYPVRAITNGVHAATWTAPAFHELYDRHIPDWRRDNLYLRYAIGISVAEIQQAHAQAKSALIQEVKKATGVELEQKTLTIGFARRATAYKRADLLFSNLERLRHIVRNVGPLQVIFSGKAHPRDDGGKAMIRDVFESARALAGVIPVVYLENYDMRWGKLMTSGVDLWLNTPQRPQEASGTSGMKAALNGVPSLSVMDGWWIEGRVEGITGWAIGHGPDIPESASVEISSLYDKLETVIVPMFYGRPEAFAQVMRWAIALNGSFFNTQRMASQYVANAYPEEPEDW
jgi:starch phosphorylase